MEKVSKISVALAGNPNSGKTTLFNNLTGARQHVGNYPGVTVEKREGTCHYKGVEITVVDLPGTYSLTAFSPEELVARQFLLETPPDVVVDVLDTSNLERNLYLAVQLMELNVPLVLACNMMDLVDARGDRIDLEALSAQFDVPVVPTMGHKRVGTSNLLETILRVAESKATNRRPSFATEIEEAISKTASAVLQASNDGQRSAEWTAIKLLERDPAVIHQWQGSEVLKTAYAAAGALSLHDHEPIETVIAQQRYRAIGARCAKAYFHAGAHRTTTSDRIDGLVTHRILGFPIFIAAMFAVFWATFNVGGIPSEWIESGIVWLASQVSGLWPEGSTSPLQSLIVDGIIAGVGNVLVFVPNILVLFLFIGLLEDSGYMPRAAFIMDRAMHKLGLHGKSFIPLLLGFGCSVPAIMATRTLQHRRDRLTTMLVAPLMSCGARLPIYALLIPAFFVKRWQAPVLLLVYVIGIVLAIAVAKLLRSTFFKGESSPFVMELPPYRVPSFRDVVLHMWERSSLYLQKAGTVILALSILMWVLTNFPKPKAEYAVLQGGSPQINETQAGVVPSGVGPSEAEIDAYNLSYSFAGRLGHAMEPVLRPMGFDWKIGTALVGALAAKEVFVAQMGIVYSTGSEDAEVPLRAQLREHYSPLVGFCIMLFCLISAPCMATVAVTKRESGGWRWAVLQFAGLSALAYVVTAVVYQIGRLVA